MGGGGALCHHGGGDFTGLFDFFFLVVFCRALFSVVITPLLDSFLGAERFIEIECKSNSQLAPQWRWLQGESW